MDMGSRILAAIKAYSDRPCMGVRDTSSSLSYSWQTFETVGKRIKEFSGGLRQWVQPHDYVGICAANRPEWVMTDLACILQHVISVPIHYQLSDREMAFIINNTRVSLVVCDGERLEKCVRLRSTCPTLRHVVCMDSFDDMSTVEEYEPSKNDDDCITVVYTSGSSGRTKGVMLSEQAFRAMFPLQEASASDERVTFCYRPLAWITDRKATIATFLRGGCTGFSTGDTSRLMEELALVAPTSFSAPPLIWNKIYSEFNATLSLTKAAGEQRLLEEFSKLIPRQCRVISIGGAMVSPAVLGFMRKCFRHCQIVEAYGSTECGRIAFNYTFLDSMIDYRLESIADMGYTRDDRPYPRGELLVRTQQMFSGYVNDPEETKAALTDDGYFRTGDIVELLTLANGKPNVRVIDRKKSFFKLSQGQYVSPALLEGIYIQSLFVEQIFIYGDALDSAVMAVVVPTANHSNDAIAHDLRALAQRESLRQHEIPSHLIIEYEPFTSENGLLTLSMKPCRRQLIARYAERLKKLKSIEKLNERSQCFAALGGDSLAYVRLLHMVPHLLDDAVLDLDLTVGSEQRSPNSSPSMVFITGVTGFVGAFLLAELLKVYPSTCKFTCLVRCPSSASPMDRVRQSMVFLQLWKEEFQTRIVAVQGDLAEDRFGLACDTYENLAASTDTIFHCGATVNFVLPYSQLHPSNVGGTREVIRLATHSATNIPIQYISTLSVLPSTMRTAEVSVDDVAPDHLSSGYAQSKWVAERLISNAARCGVPVSIYRLGLMGASTGTGACNPNDIHTLFVTTLLRLGCYPATTVHGQFTALPVDVAVQRIIAQSNTKRGIHHIANDTGGIAFDDVLDGIRSCGRDVQSIPPEEWQAKLMCEPAREILAYHLFKFRSIAGSASSRSSLPENYVKKWLLFIINHLLPIEVPGGR